MLKATSSEGEFPHLMRDHSVQRVHLHPSTRRGCGQQAWKQWIPLYPHVVCRKLLKLYVLNLFFELCVMTVCCLNIWSSFERPGTESRAGNELIITFVSIAITLMTFTLTMYGAGSVLTGVQMVANRISAAGNKVGVVGSRMSRVAAAPTEYESEHGDEVIQGQGAPTGDVNLRVSVVGAQDVP